MEIIDQNDIYILTPHFIEFTLDELQAMRGLNSAELRTWLREIKYPQFQSQHQEPLRNLSREIDQLPNAVERFFMERENPDDSVIVEPAGE